MKQPDTAALIDAERNDLAARENRVAKLKVDRKSALLADFDKVAKLDGMIATEEGLIGIRKDRIAALERQLRIEEREARERDKSAAIDEIEKRYAGRLAILAALEKAIEQFSKTYAQYREVWRDPLPWPRDLLPDPELCSPPNFSEVDRRIEHPAKQGRFVDWAGALENLTENMSDRVARAIADLRARPLPGREQFNDEEEAA
jgi:hypothetical protein